MEHDPFVRGPLPVAVRDGVAIDTDRANRPLSYAVWFPAASHEPDAAVRAGHYPLIVYCHASGGHRRQSSFLCAHLASHGYVVAAADHTGNTAQDAAASAARAAAGELVAPVERDARIRKVIADRVPDLRFLVDRLVAGAAGEVSAQIDDERIGLVGWSFGGWAVLATPEVDDRIGAVVALAPCRQLQAAPRDHPRDAHLRLETRGPHSLPGRGTRQVHAATRHVRAL